MKAALYARCSVASQSLEIQLTELRRYADARGFEIVEEFLDHGVSGARDSRPALDRMMAAAKSRRFSVVLIARLDRLGRNSRHLLNLIEDLQSLRISLVSISENLDLLSPSGRLMVIVLAALSAFERDLIRDRCMAGIEAARRKGKRLGRPPTVNYGRIRELRGQGMTFRAIMAATGYSMGAVQTALQSKTM